MTSAEELRAHWQCSEKLDGGIDVMEHDEGRIQCQLNAVVEPVAHLPFEIWSQIFLQSLDTPFSKPGALHIPMLLLNICGAWTVIALATPTLWTAIQIDFPCAKGLAQVLPIWFQRACNRPLSVSLRGDFRGYLDHSVCAIVWEHGEQLKHLEISNDVHDDGHDYDDDDDEQEVDLFGGTSPRPLPFLETLTIRCTIEGRRFHGHQILEVLRLAPNVVECTVGGRGYMYDFHQSRTQIIALANLRRLIFGECAHGDDEVLKYLSLPALEALSVPMYGISFDHLVNFFRRSAPPLRELAARWPSTARDFAELHECLHLIPSVVRFKMWRPPPDVIVNLLTALGDSPALLPNLSHLSIHLNSDGRHMSESAWRTFLRAVSTRRFQFSVLGVLSVPPPDVVAAFRELVLDGIEIYIGTKGSNFIIA